MLLGRPRVAGVVHFEIQIMKSARQHLHSFGICAHYKRGKRHNDAMLGAMGSNDKLPRSWRLTASHGGDFRHLEFMTVSRYVANAEPIVSQT